VLAILNSHNYLNQAIHSNRNPVIHNNNLNLATLSRAMVFRLQIINQCRLAAVLLKHNNRLILNPIIPHKQAILMHHTMLDIQPHPKLLLDIRHPIPPPAHIRALT
jgi:hypothetical protein